MGTQSRVGAVARHGVTAVVEAALVVAIAATLVVAASVVTNQAPGGAEDAFAAKGGKPGVTATGAFISVNEGSDLRLGGAVTFSSQAGALGGGEYPMIVVACFSDATGDKVYAQLDRPEATFVLGGGSSKWWNVGGAADCKATLYAYGGKDRGYDTIRTLAGPVTFHAGG